MKQSDNNNYQAFPESITMKLGKNIIVQLRDLAMKQSMKRQEKITTTELIREAIKHTYPFIKD